MARVTLNLSDLPIPEKVQKARRVVKAMTGNPKFPKPDPTLEKVTTDANALAAAYNDALAARETAARLTGVQNDKDAALDATLTALGGHIQAVSGGDAAVIESVGVDTKAPNRPVGDLPAPSNMTATAGDRDGEMDLSWDRVRGANSYVVEMCEDVEKGVWVPVPDGLTTKSRLTVTGLKSGARLWFRAAAVGAAGRGAWSNPVAKVAP